jgi:hypothetical protein
MSMLKTRVVAFVVVELAEGKANLGSLESCRSWFNMIVFVPVLRDPIKPRSVLKSALLNLDRLEDAAILA